MITNLFPAPGTASFAGSFVVQQLRALQKYYQPIVIVPHQISPLDFLRGRLSKVERINGLDVYFLNYFPVLIFSLDVLRILTRSVGLSPTGWQQTITYWLQGRLKRYLSSRIVVHAKTLHQQYRFQLVHGQEVFVGDEAARVGKILKIPSFVTIHSLYHFHEELLGPWVMPLALANLRQADHLLTVSDIAKETYATKVDTPITVIPNGYTPVRLSAPPPAVAHFVKGKTVILHAGFLIPLKRADLLLKAFRQLVQKNHDLRLIIIGIGPLLASLKSYVEKHGLAETVYFAGEVPPATMPSYYAIADLIVQPSRSESFSMICLEGMAYGKPFICTNRAGIAEYVTNGKEALIIKPDNLDSLVQAMNDLVTHNTKRIRMGKAAHKTARTLEWGQVVQRIIQLYRGAVRQGA